MSTAELGALRMKFGMKNILTTSAIPISFVYIFISAMTGLSTSILLFIHEKKQWLGELSHYHRLLLIYQAKSERAGSIKASLNA